MDEIQTMVRTQLAVNDAVFLLAQGEELDDLKSRIESAAQSPGKFVDFTVVGNRSVSVLISSRTTVTLSTETVQLDPRDNGDDLRPFGGMFDF